MRRFLPLLLASCLLPGEVLGADAVSFRYLGKVLANGKDRPFIEITANEPVPEVAVDLTRPDGQKLSFRTGKMKAGETRRFDLDIPKTGEHLLEGTLTLGSGEDAVRGELSIAAEYVAPATLEVADEDFDLETRSLVFRSSRVTTRVLVEVMGDTGEVLGERDMVVDSAPPNTPIRVSWEQRTGAVMKVKLTAWAPDEFFGTVELWPWSIDIPHEEVVFPTASADISREEAPKLDKSLRLILDAVKRYGRFADVKLYVAGHTDSVGAAEANQALSLARARSIAGWFRRKGLRVPIFYEGFGEQALKVGTPDETAEAQNRRAEYILAVEPPRTIGRQAGWKPVQ